VHTVAKFSSSLNFSPILDLQVFFHLSFSRLVVTLDAEISSWVTCSIMLLKTSNFILHMLINLNIEICSFN